MQRGLDPKQGYARYAHEYDELEKFWDSFEQNKLDPYIAESAGKRVLDAGAGTGRVSLKLHAAGAKVTALDISPEMLAKLHQKEPDIEIVEGDMEDMPFEDEQFDMVFSSLALVHLKKVESFLNECYRVLKDGGKTVLVNIHYRKSMLLKDNQGKYTIEAYNHFPRHLTEAAEKLAFGVEYDEILTEGDDVWVSQMLVLRK
ncbi:class I SAM-dependent methyltransferase [Patescibacteria group bacterium]|nr:class I SAM-dependent methyltransferase [Patescibacteria group bacterium]MBU1016205.1 class I SAM-dependent methyltransferase [Patescibacteria group bacterium]MBU1684678.1 class I SAM-dependent methyltransferase [Patescibacteria group bacterium]MBU1938929.1 class I SAM-dependent methyltransferase [Patescibacteria group bacterium]